jgi:hypothetical protein
LQPPDIGITVSSSEDIGHQLYLNAAFYLSRRDKSDSVFSPLGEVQQYLLMFGCGNIVLLINRFYDVAKFTTLIPLSFLISCEVSFPTVGLKNILSPYFLIEI